MWNVECMDIPVITGATGRVTEVLKKNLEAIPGKHSTDSLQKKNSYTWKTTHNTEKYCSLKLEALAVRTSVGSREVPGRKCL
jgi:hypothetical protein